MKVLIVKLTSLGDILFALPVAADIKRVFPSAQVFWSVDAMFADLVHLCRNVDGVYAFSFRHNRAQLSWQGAKEILAEIRRLRETEFDVVLDLQGMWKSAFICRLAKSREKWGYARQDLAERGAGLAYTHRLRKMATLHPVPGYRAELAQLPEFDPKASSPALQPDFGFETNQSLNQANPLNLVASPTAIFFPFASHQEKIIPLTDSKQIVAALAKKGYQVLIPAGSKEEIAQAEQLVSDGQARLLPRLSVAELIGVFRQASCFVGADTGLTQIAAAVGLPVYAVFRSTDLNLLGPHLWAARAQSFSMYQTDWFSKLLAGINQLA